jgi:hypothetical protein
MASKLKDLDLNYANPEERTLAMAQNKASGLTYLLP